MFLGCHHDGTMRKITLRLPDWEVAELRERGRVERRSMNTVAGDAIARGLAGRDASADDLRALGSMVARPALRAHSPGEGPPRAELDQALDWTRGER
jgi:hypothetical protein